MHQSKLLIFSDCDHTSDIVRAQLTLRHSLGLRVLSTPTDVKKGAIYSCQEVPFISFSMELNVTKSITLSHIYHTSWLDKQRFSLQSIHCED